MKRWISYVLLIILTILPVGCTSRAEGKGESKNEFDMMKAISTTENYMKYLIDNNVEGISKLYASDLKGEAKPQDPQSLKTVGYNIDEISQTGMEGSIKVKVVRSNNSGSPGSSCSLDEYTIKVAKEDGKYKIKDIKTKPMKEATAVSNQIREKNRDNVKTDPIISMDDIPQYAFSKVDRGSIDKLLVSKDGFGPMNYGYDGDRIAISTMGKNSLLAMVDIEESMQTQGGGGGGQGGQGGGGGQGGQGAQGGQGGATSGREKPIGKNITIVDVFKDSQVQSIAFAQDRKIVAVQYLAPTTGIGINLYNTRSGDPVEAKLIDMKLKGKVDVTIHYFEKGYLQYRVTPRTGFENDPNAQSAKGSWKLDLEKKKTKKVET
ncbi:MAG: hypothetical protein Q8936_08745 [Bacillota bacterium]|nr:hypothetical protein [Bacillota bacterium]